MGRTRSTAKAAALLAALMILLSGCVLGPSKEGKGDAYRGAIEQVPGVERADVRYSSDGLSGSSTHIEVFTDTNDKDALLTVLHRSLQAFLGQVDDGESSHLYFAVYSADTNTVVGPPNLGYDDGSLRSLKEDYEPPAD